MFVHIFSYSFLCSVANFIKNLGFFLFVKITLKKYVSKMPIGIWLPIYWLMIFTQKGRVGNTVTFSYSFSEAEFLLAYFFPFIFASQHSFLCYTFRALNYAKFPIIFHDSCRNYYWNSRAQPSQMIISNASKNSQSFEGHLESKSNVGNSRENW